jgi:CheY-like chemotaxis protein
MQGMRSTRWASKDGKPPGPARQLDEDPRLDGASPALLRKVLVVDDEQDLADLAAALLSAHGLEVVVAYSGHAAMQVLADDQDIDAVFSDVVMPGMTGLQMADAIREMYPKVKVVLASGYTVPSLLANRERPYLYTPKPYKIDTVLALLRT